MKRKFNNGDILQNIKIIDYKRENKKSFYLCECLICHKQYWKQSTTKERMDVPCISCSAKNRVKKQNTSIIKNLIGQRFGKWTVLSKSEKTNYWHCRCDCGAERDVFRGNLISGKSKSCGCVNSWGETQITYWLNQLNINFKSQYIFTDLKTNKNNVVRFDFAIFKNDSSLFCLIEFDGRQHFSYNNNWNQSKEAFERLQYTDKLKTEYCKQHNLRLIRLTKDDNIEEKIKEIANEIY